MRWVDVGSLDNQLNSVDFAGIPKVSWVLIFFFFWKIENGILHLYNSKGMQIKRGHTAFILCKTIGSNASKFALLTKGMNIVHQIPF